MANIEDRQYAIPGDCIAGWFNTSNVVSKVQVEPCTSAGLFKGQWLKIEACHKAIPDSHAARYVGIS